jgi:hypothetical protein
MLPILMPPNLRGSSVCHRLGNPHGSWVWPRVRVGGFAVGFLCHPVLQSSSSARLSTILGSSTPWRRRVARCRSFVAQPTSQVTVSTTTPSSPLPPPAAPQPTPTITTPSRNVNVPSLIPMSFSPGSAGPPPCQCIPFEPQHCLPHCASTSFTASASSEYCDELVRHWHT